MTSARAQPWKSVGMFINKIKNLSVNVFSKECLLEKSNYRSISMWHFCSKTASDKLDKVNERALRFGVKDKSRAVLTRFTLCSYTALGRFTFK